MMDNKKKHNELAPCGVFCKACPSYNKSCFGCSSDDKSQPRQSKWNCKIRTCCYSISGLDYCINCKDFPCKTYTKKLLSLHQDDSRYEYRYEIPKYFYKLKTLGEEQYIKLQRRRWKCNKCGGTIKFYHYQCDSCGEINLLN